jgi:hypothetical protein
LGGKTCCADGICVFKGNVEFRNGNFHPEVDEALLSLGLLRAAGRSPDDEMRFLADAIDTDAPGFELFYQAVHSLGLWPGIFNAVVIVVQFDILPSGLDSLLGKFERKEEVFRSNRIVLFRLAWWNWWPDWPRTHPYTGRKLSVPSKCFIDYIPSIAVILEVGDHGLDMVFHNCCQSLPCPLPLHNPVTRLVGPDESMAPKVFPVVFGDIDRYLRVSIAKHSLLRLGGIKLHGISRSYLAEDVSVVENGLV